MKKYMSTKVLEYIRKEIRSENFLEKARSKKTDFTRNRKMPFCDIMSFMITCGRRSLQKELEIFSEKTKKEKVSRQAFSKARENIKPEAIKELAEGVSKNIENDARIKTYKGYRLLAVDGTILDLPNNEKLMKKFGYSTNGTDVKHASALGMVVYDVLNDIALCGELFSYYDSEKKRILEFSDIIKGRESTKKPLFILDRGYPSFALFKKFIENNQKFLIRVSSNSLKEINEANKEIQTVNITRKGVTLQLKVINIVLSSGKTEKLVSNLTDEFSIDEIKWLYSKRWRIETNYQYIKYAQMLECFTGESINAIYQDFYISLLVINIAGTMYMEQKRELDNNCVQRVHNYKPSFSNLIYIIKENYAEYLTAPKLSKNPLKEYFRYKYIMQYAYADIPDRNRPRKFVSDSHRKAHRKLT